MFKQTLLAGLVSLAAFTAAHAEGKATIKADVEACKAGAASLPWCENAAAQTKSVTVDEKLISRVYTQALAKFHYKADNSANPHWKSYANAVEANENWSSNCVGMAFTVLDLLYRDGVPVGSLGRAIITDPGEDNHMVALVKAADGTIYVVGDTANPFLSKLKDLQGVKYITFADAGMVWTIKN